MDDDALRLLAATQGHVFRRAQATHLSPGELRWRLQSGAWVALRRGVYVEREVLRAAEAAGDHGLSRHALDLAALRLMVGGHTVVSHHSAARLQGIPVLEPVPDQPRLTSARGSVRRRPDYWRNVAQLPASHLSTDGLMTSPARTALDLAREVGFAGGVVSADAVLHSGAATTPDLLAVLDACRDWPGAVVARQVAEFADGRSESPHESLCRVGCHEAGLPAPTPQLWIRDEAGYYFARADLAWEQQWTLLEADGLMKYVSPTARRGPDPLALEKQRQVKLEDLGWEVVRVLWAESRFNRSAMARRVERAFERSARRHAA